MSESVIDVQNLSKRYKIGTVESYRTFRDTISESADSLRKQMFGFFDSREKSEAETQIKDPHVWALKDVSFTLKQGEALGVIGANGAGKTTLLKILSRITDPTEGCAKIRGRVGALLEVGAGFHPELTGRENVFLSGVILGMSRSEVQRKFDDIVAFAGVEKFIDTPVKRYSSGMYIRLAFSVAAFIETDILFIDEVLAVGDAAFQLKCLSKISEFSGSDKTILFVSHNLEAVSKICSRSILLDQGRLIKTGPTQECIDQYLSELRKQRSPVGREVSLVTHAGRTKIHQGPVQFTALQVLNERGTASWTVHCGKEISVVLGFELQNQSKSQNALFTVTFSDMYNHRISTCRSFDACAEMISVDRSGKIVCKIPKLQLRPGLYRISVGCNTDAGYSDGVYDAALLEVAGTDYYPSNHLPPAEHGNVLFDHKWKIE